jgi:hypothetical protein
MTTHRFPKNVIGRNTVIKLPLAAHVCSSLAKYYFALLDQAILFLGLSSLKKNLGTAKKAHVWIKQISQQA